MRRPGDPEVENLDDSFGIHHQVGGLDVAMDQARLVRVREAATELLDEVQLLGERERRPPPNELVQRLARNVLHGDVRPAILISDIVDGDDVRVAQPAGGARLAGEPFARVLVFEISPKHLDGDEPVDRRVEGEVQQHPSRPGRCGLEFHTTDFDGGRSTAMQQKDWHYTEDLERSARARAT